MRPPLRFLALFALAATLPAADRPQWGEAWTRNQVSAERGLPDSFDPATGHNIKWTAKLGTESYATPVIAHGRVYLGTNNNVPRDPRHQGDRVYVVSNRAEVLCLDAKGLADGNDGPFKDEAAHQTPAGQAEIPTGPTDADILWRFDLRAGAGIWPHDGAHSSILIRGDQLYLNTGTGVDNSHAVIRTPDAPSLVVLDKNTGRLLARDDEHIAPNIFHSTWSPPSMAKVDGRELIFFGGGDGIVRAFEPLAKATDEVQNLKVVWRYDLDPEAPKVDVHRFLRNTKIGPSDIFGLTVFANDRLYVAGGGDIWWGKLAAWLKCVDAKDGHELWSYPLNKHVMSSPCVAGDVVYIADIGRTIHCLDATTGAPLWTHPAKAEFWASPSVADGKMYIGTRKGDFYVFATGREKKLLSTVELGAPVAGSAVAANGTLYVATMKELYAIAEGANTPPPAGAASPSAAPASPTPPAPAK